MWINHGRSLKTMCEVVAIILVRNDAGCIQGGGGNNSMNKNNVKEFPSQSCHYKISRIYIFTFSMIFYPSMHDYVG